MSKRKSAPKSTAKKTTAKSSKSKKSVETVVSAGPLTRKVDRTKLNKNTWVVFRGIGERKPMLFDAALTRDKVRGAYAKTAGISKERTRSRRLMNY